MKQGQLKAHDYPEVYKGLGLNLATLGCVMLDLVPLENMHSIEAEGHKEGLYYAKDKSRFWIDGWCADKTPHITLLYGLLQTAKNYKWHIDQVMKGWLGSYAWRPVRRAWYDVMGDCGMQDAIFREQTKAEEFLKNLIEPVPSDKTIMFS